MEITEEYKIGSDLLSQRKYDEALGRFNGIINSTFSDSLKAQAWIYRALALTESGSNQYNDILSGYENGIRIYDETKLKLDAFYTTAFLNKGWVLCKMTPPRWSEAKVAYDKAIGCFEKLNLKNAQYALALISKGIVLGNILPQVWDEIIQTYKKAIQVYEVNFIPKDIEYARACENLAWAYTNEEHQEIEVASQVIDIGLDFLRKSKISDSNFASALITKTRVLFSQKPINYPKILSVAEEIINLYSDGRAKDTYYAQAFLNEAFALTNIRPILLHKALIANENVVKTYEEAKLAIDVYYATAWFNIGWIHCNLNPINYKKVLDANNFTIEIYNKYSIPHDGTYAGAHNNRGWAYSALNKSQEAYKSYHEAVTIANQMKLNSSDTALFLQNLADTLLKFGNIEKALETVNEALNLVKQPTKI